MSTQKTLRGDIPVDGWVDKMVPESVRPYIRLMRLDRPIGIYLVMWPCFWSATLAADRWPDWGLLALFALGSIIMRSAGCAVNDIADHKFDAEVERTAHRPIPSGQITVNQAVAFFGLLCLAGLLILIQLNPFTIAVGAASMALVITYPFMKRITYWPQLFLGLTFNWGAFVGWAAVTGELAWPALVMYIGGVFWTLGYDTTYALLDRKDDVNAGVKSSALALQDRSIPFIAVAYALALVLFGVSGWMTGVHWIFYPALLAPALHLLWQVSTLDLDDKLDPLQKFKSNRNFGLYMWLAYLAGAVLR